MKRALLMLVVTSLVFLISAPTYGQMGGGGEEYGKVCGGEGPSHDTHTQGIAKGPDPLSCHDCHGRKCKKEFADGEPLATTTVCNNCHSQGGAFDGVQMAKDNWDSGVYEADGSLKSGNEYWCASCHDADQASSNQDGSGEAAPDISGDNSSYGYYVTGHGRESEYPLMYYQGGSGNGNPGADLVCAHCHDSTSEHIVAGQSVTRLKSGYENDQSNSNCNQCHPPGTWATADPELYTNSDEYEAAHHGGKLCAECHEVHGMVAEAYPAMAIGGARTLCLSCHDGTTAPAASEPPAAHSETSETTCSSCHNPHMPAHGAGAEGVGCESCHGHDAGYEYEPGQFSQGAGTYKSHSTHTEDDSDDLKGPYIACDICHDTNSYPNFTDGATSLAATTVCNNCHSQGGAFDGVQMAKDNWDSGVYEVNGKTLQSGKEHWCATCHDNQPANSKKDGFGVNAPNVVGDNTDYGFYVTGHKINCLSCHNANKKHIDHEHRTYEVDEGVGILNPYGDSYRLKLTSSKPSQYLCFGCHNSSEILGQDSSDVSHTNFWNDDSDIKNSHWLHLVGFTGTYFDSDWDGVHDSRGSCIACHNVHGSPTKAMIRHGELISSYGTTDKVPALNFAYLIEPTEFATATWTPVISEAGDYKVYAWWKASPNRATNAKYTIYYDDGFGNIIASDPIEVNQEEEENGSKWNQLGTGTYYFAAGTSGYVELTNQGADDHVIADAVGWDTDDDDTPDIIVDNPDAEFVGDWGTSSSGGYNGGNYRWHAKPVGEPDPDATLVESVGGRMRLKGPGVGDNGVCWACHSGASHERKPYLGPKVLMGKAEPDPVAKDGSGTSLITVFVLDPDGNVSTVEIDLTPLDGIANQAMNDDGGGYYSHQITIPADTPDSPLTFVITAIDDDTNIGKGTATVGVVEPDSIYVDNLDAEFVCDWTYASGVSGAYNGDHYYHAAGNGSCTATWTPDIPESGNYKVYAWWKASPNRATNAKYTIYYDDGSGNIIASDPIEVNQKENGSQWNQLGTGTHYFAAGQSGYVVLSDDANQYVIADAIKLVPQP